jgi:hypothetical protein
MGRARVAAPGVLLEIQVGLLALGPDFPALVVQDYVALGATPLDSPGTVVQAIVQSGLMLPNEGETGNS